MGYLDRIRACHHWPAENFRPFVLEGEAGAEAPLGWVEHGFARRLADFPRVFAVSDEAVVLPARYDDFDSRTAVLQEVVQELHARGEVPNWRDEDYGVCRRWGEAPLFRLERGAVPLLGLPAYGVHVNGYVATAEGLRLWVGRRSKHKALAPGKLDHLIAGGQPYGLSLRDNVIKEAAEEASVPADLAARARPVGALGYLCSRAEGQRNDVLFCYDLELPAEFVARPDDDEVEEFFLWPMEQVLARLRDSEDFKFNVALVNLHFALRHGYLDPDEEADYQAIVAALQTGIEA